MAKQQYPVWALPENAVTSCTSRWQLRLGAAIACCVAAAAAHANPPFQTDDPGVFPLHTGQMYLFSAGGHAADGTSLDAAPGVEVNYSLIRNTFAHLVIPLAYDTPNQGASAYGLGTVKLGFKWRFLSQRRDGIDVATFPRAELPTGSR